MVVMHSHRVSGESLWSAYCFQHAEVHVKWRRCLDPAVLPVWSCLLVCPCLSASYPNSISQEAERLKHENEELRKLGEDAVLDQQLSKALQETDKLKLAADAYKKELLQQKVGELQAELAQTTKRLKVAEEEKSGVWKSLHMA